MLIEGQNFLVLGEQWGFFPSTTEHLLRRLVPHNRFLWVHEMGCRAPELNLYTLRRAVGKVMHWASPNGIAVGPNGIATYSPAVVPLPPITPVRWWNRRAMARGINQRLQRLGIEKPILFTMSPIAAEILNDLDTSLVVYYIVDNYEEMPHWYSGYVRELEARMMEQADVVLATSQPLVDRKSRPGRSITLVPQGVDFEHFHAPVADRTAAPEDLAQIPGPRILFMGLLAPWVDVDLMAKVAREYPRASLVVLGPVHTEAEALRREPNVYFLGQRDYRDVPRYLAHCDAALIPFRHNALTRYVNPLKLLEYMAAGLPVVSTALPHVRVFDGLIYCAQTPEQFVEQVGEALTSFTPERRERCVAAAGANGWRRRTEQLSQILQDALTVRAAQRSCVPS